MIGVRRWYGGLPLRWKIMTVVMSVCAAALLWALSAFIALDLVYVRRSISEDISAQAEIVASQSEAALVFGDRDAAQETLAALGRHTHVRRVLLYAADGSLFANYLARGATLPPENSLPQPLEGLKLSGGALSVVKNINRRGESLGWVYVESNMREFYERLGWLASVTLLILAVAVPVVFLAARFLQAPIADPLISLVGVTRSVTQEEDYSVRAYGAGRDEIGELIEAFNKMLDQIQTRDEKLKRHAVELEHRVAERTSELTVAKEQAEAATLLKDKFVSLVSHDLRSPLASISGAAEMLLSAGDYDLSEEKKTHMLSRLRVTSAGMLTLIDKLLDISRLQTGQIVPIRSVVRPRSIVAECAAALEHMAERKRITVVNEVPGEMIGYVDYVLFREVVHNLLTNALKFTPEGSRVTVWSPDGGERKVAVTDTGKGVPSKIIGDLFKHDVKTTTIGTGGEKGTGLGLPYSRDIMKVHNGDISVESREGEGSTFTVSLPPIKAMALVVEDQAAQRSIIRDILQEVEGLAVMEAVNGRNALETMGKVIPGLVITDLDMPEMGGFTLIERMREDGRIADTPVIVVSAFAQLGAASCEEVTHHAGELGVARVLAKPIVREELLAAVREFVKG